MTTTERHAPGALMAAEIDEQPAVAERLLTTAPAHVRAVADQISRAGPRFVLLAARGSSDHAALYTKYLLEIVLGLPCGLASLSTITTYGARPVLKDVLWIAVSQSGESPDLVESTRVARSCGALTLAITNSPSSPLASASRLSLDIDAGPERSVAATKTYTATLLMVWLLVDALRSGRHEHGRELPAQIEAALGGEAPERVARALVGARRLVVTGRGYNYPTAREAALKLMETSYVSAQAFSGADLLHGPVAMVDQDQPVLAIVPEGRSVPAMRPVLRKLHEVRANVYLVGPARGTDPDIDPHADPATGAGAHLSELDWGVPSMHDEVSPIAGIVPLQRLALHLALLHGHDPDQPRGLSKRTHTL